MPAVIETGLSGSVVARPARPWYAYRRRRPAATYGSGWGMASWAPGGWNLRQDIDLILPTPRLGRNPRRATQPGSIQEFFIPFGGQRLIKAWNAIYRLTVYVFRVDMRLRPYGGRAALVFRPF